MLPIIRDLAGHYMALDLDIGHERSMKVMIYAIMISGLWAERLGIADFGAIFERGLVVSRRGTGVSERAIPCLCPSIQSPCQLASYLPIICLLHIAIIPFIFRLDHSIGYNSTTQGRVLIALSNLL